MIPKGAVIGSAIDATPAALLAAAAALAVAAGSGEAKAIPNLSIQLISPTPGSVIPRYGASPSFTWRISARGLPPPKGSGRLEVSTTRAFDAGGDLPLRLRLLARRLHPALPVAERLAALVRHGEQLQRRPAGGRELREPLDRALLARPLPAGRRPLVLEPDRDAPALGAPARRGRRPPRPKLGARTTATRRGCSSGPAMRATSSATSFSCTTARRWSSAPAPTGARSAATTTPTSTCRFR